MGLVTAEFDTKIFPNGIPFKHLRDTLDSLPGESRVTVVYEAYDSSLCTNLYVVCFKNDNFPDGTKVVSKYKQISAHMGAVTVFDGVDVIWMNTVQNNPLAGVPGQVPPPPSPTGITSGNGQYTIPNIQPTYTLNINGSHVQHTGTYIPATHPYQNIGDDAEKESPTSCDCGADSVGGGHSNWCSTNVPF